MPAQRRKPMPSSHGISPQGLAMAVLASACFATAVAYDTNVHSTFDLPKLAFLLLAALAILIGACVRLLTRGELKLPRTPLDLPLVAVLCTAVLATLFSVDPRCSVFGAYKTYEGLVQIAAYAVLLWTATLLRRSQVVVVVGASLMAALGAASYGLVQRLGHDPLGWTKTIAGREISTFGNPVFYGMFLALFIPAAVGLALRDTRAEPEDRRAPWWWLGTSLAAIVFTTWVYTELHKFRGAESMGSGLKALILVVASVLISLGVGHRVLRNRSAGWRPLQSWWALATALLLSAALYTSRTVGVLVAEIVALAVFVLAMLVLDRSSFSRHRRRWALLLTLLLAVNVGFNLWPATSTTDRLGKLLFRSSETAGGGTATEQSGPQRQLAPSGSFYKRVLLFRSGFSIFAAHPILGVGPDCIERAIATHWAKDWQVAHGNLVEVEGFENRVHNEAIELLASQGVLGFAARLWLYLGVLLVLWRGLRREEPGELPVLLGLGCSWLLMVVCNLVEYPTIPISTGFWILSGLMVAWVQHPDSEVQQPVRILRLPWRPTPLFALLGLGAGLAAATALWLATFQLPFAADRAFMAAQFHLKRGKLQAGRAKLEEAVSGQPQLHVYREQLCTVLVKICNSLATSKDPATLREAEAVARDLITHATEATRYSPWRGHGFAFLATGQELLAELMVRAGEQIDMKEVAALRRAAGDNLRHAIEVNPHNVALRTMYARHDLSFEGWDEYFRIVEESLALWPYDRKLGTVVLQGAAALTNSRQYDRAEKLLLTSKDRLPLDAQPGVWEGLGRIYWMGQRWSELEGAGRTLLNLEPQSAVGHRFVAMALLQTGKLEQARRAVQSLAAIQPEDEFLPWARNALKHLSASQGSATGAE